MQRSVDPIINTAESVLRDYFGKVLTLEPVRVWDGIKSNVIRCCVDLSYATVPTSVIVKQSKCESALEDWAASLFLRTIDNDPPLAPICYGGNPQLEMAVFEDLGDETGSNTLDLLMSDDPDAATAALIEHIRLLARLHAATLGKADEYAEIRGALGPLLPAKPLYNDPWSDARREAIPQEDLDQAIQGYRQSLSVLGLTPSAGIADEIEYATQAVEGDPGPFLSFCQGDVNTPESCIRRSGRLRLLDFDSSGFRHAFTEGLAGRLMWGCQLRIPETVLKMMDQAYRDVFSEECTLVRDDHQYALTIAQAAARWHIFHVIWRLPTALERDYQRGLSSLRQQLLAWLDAFGVIADENNQMPALRDCAEQLLKHLRAMWSSEIEEAPFYPAFAG